MKRVMIIGQPGAGKSTVARLLGARTGLPVVHIDHIHWQAGWVERPDAEKDVLIAEVHAKDRWIFEGGRSATWPERLARADTLIWLDVPFFTRSFRVLKRTLQHYGKTRADLPDGCPEKFSLEFYRWIWSTRHTGHDLAKRTFDTAPKENLRYRLRTKRDVQNFLESL